MLSEGKEQVGDTHTVQWVSDMETKLLTSLDYTEGCIMQLFDLCTSLVEHRRKKRGKSSICFKHLGMRKGGKLIFLINLEGQQSDAYAARFSKVTFKHEAFQYAFQPTIHLY